MFVSQQAANRKSVNLFVRRYQTVNTKSVNSGKSCWLLEQSSGNRITGKYKLVQYTTGLSGPLASMAGLSAISLLCKFM
jgi:hypothetical protein